MVRQSVSWSRRYDSPIVLARGAHGFGSWWRFVPDESLHRTQSGLGIWRRHHRLHSFLRDLDRVRKTRARQDEHDDPGNNCMQSTASAAGYSTGGTLISAFAAYIIINNQQLSIPLML